MSEEQRPEWISRVAAAWGRTGGAATAAGLVAFFSFFLFTTFGLTLSGGPRWRLAAPQPVAFNHRLHVEELELECTSCHAHYEEETFSGLPAAEACSFCHEEAQGESAEEAKLAGLLAAGEALDWEPLFQQPAHVFYSHRRHVVVAGIACDACHGDFAGMERPPRTVTTLTMDGCIGCHEREQAGLDCTHCHR